MMKQQDFLNRFKSRAPLAPPTFERDELARWADALWRDVSTRREALAAQFAQALELAGGQYHHVPTLRDAARCACDLVRAHEADAVVAWNHPALDGACEMLQALGVRVTRSDANVSSDIRQQTIASDVGLTSCDYAIAETGTLLLVANAKQGRLTSLVPITHVAIITPNQLVPTFADAMKLLRLARLAGDGRLPSNVSLHTGPSKTADIEQTLTRGVHGPKEVH
ncbi:MAG: lactate utilization protein, partial [Chloroflexi bacterium]|nr:lactate utilization protein [Chloroflexota bacterium]